MPTVRTRALLVVMPDESNKHPPLPRGERGPSLRTVDRSWLTQPSNYPRAASSCEATLMYLRPASCAAVTAACSVWPSRMPASLISIGRLMPAITSTLARSSTEMARLEGVPPNMSVSSTTPSPVSTSLTRSRISLRRCSMSSSAPMQTVATFCCLPTTCSSAARNSAASLPCVTRTIPIIDTSLFFLGLFRPAGNVLRQIAMNERDRAAAFSQCVRQAFRNIDRSMFSAGASDGDGEIAFALALIARQQGLDQGVERGHESGQRRIALDECGDLRRLAVQR